MWERWRKDTPPDRIVAAFRADLSADDFGALVAAFHYVAHGGREVTDPRPPAFIQKREAKGGFRAYGKARTVRLQGERG